MKSYTLTFGVVYPDDPKHEYFSITVESDCIKDSIRKAQNILEQRISNYDNYYIEKIERN